VSRYQKGKTNLDFTEARDSKWQWHQLCKSAPHSRQITTPAPHHSVFTGRMLFLQPNQQRQSTEGNYDGEVGEKNKTNMLRSVGKQSGKSVKPFLKKKKRKATVGRICRKRSFKPGVKE